MDSIPELIDNIYQVFKDYFGEENVDLQNFADSSYHFDYFSNCNERDYILIVHWDEVVVSNEYDDSITIWDLYCVSIVSLEGKLRTHPFFNRSTYDQRQWNSGYLHSHVMRIPYSELNRFQQSCLGTGPIVGTIRSLMQNGNDLDLWRLYCWELDKYVHVESLSGGPYRRLSEVGAATGKDNVLSAPLLSYGFPASNSTICKDCARLLLKLILENNILKYSYTDNRYVIGMPFIDVVLSISNTFINWYNSNPSVYKKFPKDKLFEQNFLEKVKANDGSIVRSFGASQTREMGIGTSLFKFKEDMITLKLHVEPQPHDSGELIVVNIDIINYLLYLILEHINIYYGKNENGASKKPRII